MNNKIKNILLKLEQNGFKSFIVGGYVRDSILGNETTDVDIATPALPKDVVKILKLNKVSDEYGCVSFKDIAFNYDVTTFRKEGDYVNRKPTMLEFVDDVYEDAKRRDFTINAIYEDADGNFIDPYNGIGDIENKVIKMIGNPASKITEDPLRILRAIRLVSELNFDLDKNLENLIKQNKILITTLSNTRKKEELDLIFKGKYKEKALKLIKSLNISDELGIKIKDDIVICDNHLGMWAQTQNEFEFTSKEQDALKNIKKIIKYGFIDKEVLFEYGLYPCYLAGEILGVSKSQISDLYKTLPIYTSKDIKITSKEIMELLSIGPSEMIKDIMFDLEINILNEIIPNDNLEIKKYLMENWRKK